MVNRLSASNQFKQAEASLPRWEELPRAGEPVDGFANGAFVSATGLVLPTDLDFNEWKDLGTKLVTMRSGNQWALGDWWAYGEHKYGDRKKAVEEAGIRLHYKFNSLMNLATISRKFPPSSRNEVLKFTHHKIVAALPVEDRTKWLARAASMHWSVEKLQKAIQILPTYDEIAERAVWIVEFVVDGKTGAQGTAFFLEDVGLVTAYHVLAKLPSGVKARLPEEIQD
jgi:hypothetical protein